MSVRGALTTQTTRKKPPPYAAEVVKAKAAGEFMNVFLCAGLKSWERAQLRPVGQRLCLPPDESPQDFDWACVRGLSLTVVDWDCTDELIIDLGTELVRAGALLVVVLSPLHGYRMRFKPRVICER